MKLTVSDLNSMTAFQVLENEHVKERVIQLYENVHGRKEGELFYEKEKYNIMRMISQSADLASCQGFSIYGTFLDLATMGLTLASNGGQPYLYLLSRSANTAPKGQQANWVKRMYLEVSPYGELSLRIAAGQILHADRPIVVYEGDTFQPGVDERGNKYVKYSTSIPRSSSTIIGAFFKITRPDRTHDFFWMLPDDIQRLAGYSQRQNSRGNAQGTANALYSSNGGQIDPGFLEAKTIKHAFKTFPKIALGQFATLQQSDEPVQAVDYGLDEEIPNQTPEPQAFGSFDDEPEPQPQGISIDLPDNDEGF